MTKENQPHGPPLQSKVAELRTAHGRAISESTDPVDLLLNEHLGQMASYKKVDVQIEWQSFLSKIYP